MAEESVVRFPEGYGSSMRHSTALPGATRFRSPAMRRPRGVSCHGFRMRLLVFLLGALSGSAGATGPGPYDMADGGRTADIERAAQSWRDDREFQGNWGLAAIRAEYAYARGYRGQGARIGVIDQPVWVGHPEFSSRSDMENKLTFLATRGVRTYTDPYLPFRAGESFENSGRIYVEAHGGPATHGTHVAGIAAANRDTVDGRPGVMQGVAFDAQVFAADNGDPGPEDGIVRGNDGGVYLAAWQAMIDSKVHVVTNSWGIGSTPGIDWDFLSSGKQFLEIRSLLGTPEGGAYDGALRAARSGIVIEFSAGNNGGRHPDAMVGLATFVPEIENNWIVVTSLSSSEEGLNLSNFSNICGYTKYYCVAAPGGGINSSIVRADTADKSPGDTLPDVVADHALLSGTSMSGPFVSGALGVLKGRFPYLANGDLAQILKTTAADLGQPGVDEVHGWGLIDLRKALNGPGQLLTRMVADLPAGQVDVWSNDIGDAALRQRQTEALAEIAAWRQRKADNGWARGWAQVDAQETTQRLLAEYRPRVAAAKEQVRRLIEIRATPPYRDFSSAFLAVESDPVASAIVAQFGREVNWLEFGPDPSVFDRFIAARYPDDESLARGLAELAFREQGLEYRVQEQRMLDLAAQTYENGLVKRGAGELRLTGNNTYRGETVVEAGRLTVDGSQAGGVTVVERGTLGGSGRIGALRMHRGGTLAPGASIGTLTVDGQAAPGDDADSARFEKGSHFVVDIDADGRSDRLAVAGKASLRGGLVSVWPVSPATALDTLVAASRQRLSYTVLSAEGGVEGRFAAAATPYLFFRPALHHEENTVSLSIERLPFATRGRTFNEKQTAAGVERLGDGHGLYARVLATPAGPGGVAVFAALSGDIHPTLHGALFDDARFPRDAAIARLRAHRQGGSAAPESWGELSGTWKRAGSDGNAAAYDRDLVGFLAGSDSRISDDWTVGFLAGFGEGNLKTRWARAETDSYRVGVHAGGYRDALGFRFGAGYARHVLTTYRAFPAGNVEARYNADDWQAFVELGYDLGRGSARLEPFAGLAYGGMKAEAFAEKGSLPERLSGGGGRLSAASGSLGLRVAQQLSLATMAADFSGSLAWRHTPGDVRGTTRLAFPGARQFVNHGLPLDRNALAVTANLRVSLSPGARIGLDYAGQLSRNSREHRLAASFSVEF